MANTPEKESHHHYFLHDISLLKSLTVTWLAILLSGTLLHQGLRYFHDHDHIQIRPRFSTSSTSHSDPSWKHLESHGDVELLRRLIDLEDENAEYASMVRTFDTVKGLYAHRAVATVDIPIESLVHVFRDTPGSVEWAKDLKEAEEYHKSGVHHDKKNKRQLQSSIVRQRYNVPIPGISDREFLMHKKMTAIENRDGTHSKVTYEFTSLTPEEELDPTSQAPALCTGCTRGINLGSKWIFTALVDEDDGSRSTTTTTRIEAEVAVDPKTPNLSTFFINNFQKSWPHVSVHGLMKVARHHLHRDGDVQVTNSFFRLFPLKI
mmetsp:Transcript_22697/g.47435  ORF Transcript_22697/g.47435 Transcript_22697/m.47435 type:complete len:320 (-) Transcript_22697:436-1395(-)